MCMCMFNNKELATSYILEWLPAKLSTWGKYRKTSCKVIWNI